MTTETLLEAPAPALQRGPTLALLRQGWDSVSGVFDAEEVQALRSAMTAAFESPAEGAKVPPACGLILADLFAWPDVARLFFTPRLFAAIRQLIGPNAVLPPEHGLHRNGFGGWHKDTDALERAGLMHHWSADYHIYQCAVYLQDNAAGTGGGISLVPGSHLVPRPRATLVDAALRDQWFEAQQQAVIESRAGDLVVFHTRCDHSATPRTQSAAYGDKHAIFCLAAIDNRHVPMYSAFIHQRKDYGYLKDYQVPPEMQARAQAHGMRFTI